MHTTYQVIEERTGKVATKWYKLELAYKWIAEHGYPNARYRIDMHKVSRVDSSLTRDEVYEKLYPHDNLPNF